MSPTREGVFVRNSRSVGVYLSSCRHVGRDDGEEERRDVAEGRSWEMSRMDGPGLGCRSLRVNLEKAGCWSLAQIPDRTGRNGCFMQSKDI